MNAYITKPVSATAQREVVQKWLTVDPQFDETDSTNRAGYSTPLGVHA
jgi:hypothetical protein